MSIWPYEWHASLRQRLDESLHLWLLNVHSLDPERAWQDIARLIRDEQLGGFAAFPLFGRKDLIVRAWIRNGQADDMRLKLCSVIEGEQGVSHRPVDRVERIHEGQVIEPDQARLQDLDESQILSVQDDGDEELISVLREACVLHPLSDPPIGAIRFFTEIIVHHPRSGLGVRLANDTREYVARQEALTELVIYTGYDLWFFELLALDFSAIASFTAWIGQQLSSEHEARTETFIVGMNGCVWPKIGGSTLSALRGRDLFVQSIVPKLYRKDLVAKRRATSVEQVYGRVLRDLELSPKNKQFFNVYAIAYVEEDENGAVMVLFELLNSFERFLQGTIREFAGRAGIDFSQVVSELPDDVKDTSKLSLGNLLFALGKVVGTDFCDWGPLVQLRNELAHGTYDVWSDWERPVAEIGGRLAHIREAVEHVRGATGRDISARYLP